MYVDVLKYSSTASHVVMVGHATAVVAGYVRFYLLGWPKPEALGYSPGSRGRSAMRTSRPARLTGGGPTWDLRTPKRASRPPRKSPIPEADAAMALNDAITGVVAALGKGDVAQARAMKRRAWEYAALLHPAQTIRQRRILRMLSRRIAKAERAGRSHGDGQAIRAGLD
jgi:hypothetical protein